MIEYNSEVHKKSVSGLEKLMTIAKINERTNFSSRIFDYASPIFDHCNNSIDVVPEFELENAVRQVNNAASIDVIYLSYFIIGIKYLVMPAEVWSEIQRRRGF